MFWYGEYSRDERPVVGIVGVAVLGHPRRPGQQQVVALHVEQRHAAHQRAEQLRVVGQHDAHQQAAVAAALGAQLVDGRDAAGHQIGCHGGEILVRPGGGPPASPGCATSARTRRRRGCWPARRCRPWTATACRARRRSRGCWRTRSRRIRRAASCPDPSNRDAPRRSTGSWCRRRRRRSAGSTSMSEASKNAGALLISVSSSPTWPHSSRDGLSNPLESRKISSPYSSASTITVVALAGMPATGSRCHEPGVTTSTRVATSTRVTRTSRSRVQA